MDERERATSKDALLDEVHQDLGRAALGQRTHQEVVARMERHMLWEKRGNAALLTLISGDSVGVLVTDARLAKIAALGLSFLALLLSVYKWNRSRERLMEMHRRASLAYWGLREDCLQVIGGLRSGACSEEDGWARREELARVRARIELSAPDADDAAREAARAALGRGGEPPFSGEEIDLLLPRSLRVQAPAPRAG